MDAPRFTHTASELPLRCTSVLEGDVLTIAADGELDLAGVALLDAQLRACRGVYRSLVLDLSALSFMDSAGVHLLQRWSAHAALTGRRLHVVPGPDPVQRVLGLTGVLSTLDWRRPAAA